MSTLLGSAIVSNVFTIDGTLLMEIGYLNEDTTTRVAVAVGCLLLGLLLVFNGLCCFAVLYVSLRTVSLFLYCIYHFVVVSENKKTVIDFEAKNEVLTCTYV